jgi:hypothetical protein
MNLPSQERIGGAVSEIFDRVSCACPNELLSGLIPVDRNFLPARTLINPFADREMQEVCEFIEGFNSLLSDINADKELKARVEVTLYCHIMEVDLLFAILWNLLRVLKKEPCQWTFSRFTKKGGIEVCKYPVQKVSEIARLSGEMKLGIGEILETLWCGNLRNAFNHSQYFLSSGYFVCTGQLSSISRDTAKTPPPGESYSYEDIHDLFSGADILLHTFIRAYKLRIGPYKDGTPHRIQAGFVTWDDQLGKWLRA